MRNETKGEEDVEGMERKNEREKERVRGRGADNGIVHCGAATRGVEPLTVGCAHSHEPFVAPTGIKKEKYFNK